MMVSMAAFVVNDAVVKLASENLSLFQVMFLRGIFSTILIGSFAWYKKQLFCHIPKVDLGKLGWRVVGEVGGTLCFLNALFNIPLANATAILQSLPLAMTFGAALFLGETVGWRRYLAIAIGFCGMLIIVRPGSEGFNHYSYWAVAAVGFVVFRDLTTRRLTANVPSLFIALLTSVAIMTTGAVLSPLTTWQPVTIQSLIYLMIASVFLMFGYLFSIMTIRIGEIGFAAPFRYTSLVWAIIMGYLMFSDIPDRWTLLGSAIVIVMGIYTFHRERKQRIKALDIRNDNQNA